MSGNGLNVEYNRGYQAGLQAAEQNDRRFAAAVAAMQGILSCHGQNWYPQSSPEALASCAVQTVDALLKELEK